VTGQLKTEQVSRAIETPAVALETMLVLLFPTRARIPCWIRRIEPIPDADAKASMAQAREVELAVLGKSSLESRRAARLP